MISICINTSISLSFIRVFRVFPRSSCVPTLKHIDHVLFVRESGLLYLCVEYECVCVREREKNAQLESVREQECVWLIQKLLTRTHTNTHTLSPSDWV